MRWEDDKCRGKNTQGQGSGQVHVSAEAGTPIAGSVHSSEILLGQRNKVLG